MSVFGFNSVFIVRVHGNGDDAKSAARSAFVQITDHAGEHVATVTFAELPERVRRHIERELELTLGAARGEELEA